MLGSPLPPFLLALALVLGAVALLVTPREEEPQIVVPVTEVSVLAPGLGAVQVERQIATPLEKLLHQIRGVEHVYSRSERGRAVVTVRFHVGEDREDALVEVFTKVQANLDQVPAAVTDWIVRPVEIDDVATVVVGLWSDDETRTDDHGLRRIAEEVEQRLQALPDTNRVTVTGGRPRRVRVELDPEALAARRTSPLDVLWALQVSNRRLPAGVVLRADRGLAVEAGATVADARDLATLVVNVVEGVPVYLGDVATVLDGPAEPASYTWIELGPAASLPDGVSVAADGRAPAVFVAVAKQRGANAVRVAADVRAAMDRLAAELFPPEVHHRVIRDHGATAQAKVDDLVTSLGAAVFTVVLFIGVFLGWRAALVVALAVPVSYGITLGLDLLFGYTINRVTLFALILALGLLVDDPITGVDNIERYLRRGGGSARDAIAAAIGEVRQPLVMSTVAIVLVFVPLSFITGMMGPYMAPMAFNVPVTVVVSTIVAFYVTPWLALKLLRIQGDVGVVDDAAAPRAADGPYARALRAVLASPARAWGFMAVVAVLFVVAVSLPAFRLVPLKLLPHDDKDELQVVLDMPEGTSLERTRAVTARIVRHLTTVAEVDTVAAFVGLPSPIDFNGLVRQYALRVAPHLADVRIVLAPKRHRAEQSHRMALRLRPGIEAIAREAGGVVRVVEVPPGPPVLATVVAEVRGEPTTPYAALEAGAVRLAERLRREPLVVEVDTSVPDPHSRLELVVDREKAALSGIAAEDVAATVALALDGVVATHLEAPREASPLPVELRFPLARRADPAVLAGLRVKGRPGIAKTLDAGGLRDAPQPLVELAELATAREVEADHPILHKDLAPVVYVYAETAGRAPAEIIQDVFVDGGADAVSPSPRALEGRTFLAPGGGDAWALPAGVRAVWTGEGEWDLTVRVFRDLGIAFAAALAGIFFVLWMQTGLAGLTGIIMLAIPLGMIGIMPGFWVLNVLRDPTAAGGADPVLFTATAMIGMIALAGIVVRGSLILVEFVGNARARGSELVDALAEAGTIRMRPVLLTAGTTLLGNLVITLDPIFSGLAWAIIFGVSASTAFTLGVIPVAYWLVYREARSDSEGVA
ncbi:MAG: efflux RND transporter permease subunit [Chromatiales bacterium]|nr:efflux RND transporter permease subunit [Chromatiales bacterium]